MTPNEKYVEGQWYGWNGGECPVHPDTVVDVAVPSTKGHINLYESRPAGRWFWDNTCRNTPIIAFRVVKHHVEPKVIWVNEYDYNDAIGVAYQTKEEAIKCAGKTWGRIAVRYVETPE